MEEYRLKKDLPGIAAGEIISVAVGVEAYQHTVDVTDPEWFEKVERPLGWFVDKNGNLNHEIATPQEPTQTQTMQPVSTINPVKRWWRWLHTESKPALA